ncbi:uncharacterized protein [Euphorbia lathyris]|uniref:uncharacterized protein n=1 Tax=Euphorbia lathyris TaxID=212925 RepID=UPI00331415CA
MEGREGVNTNISARANQKTSSGLVRKVLPILFIGLISAWVYQAIQAPPPKIPGFPGGPPITGPRIKLRDGRHLAYIERGVSIDTAKYKIIYLHPFGSCRRDAAFENHLSQELLEELGIYIVSFDRPGHGESDPHPSRTLKSLTLDIEELADQLGLGSKFYVIGYSMGGGMTWSCLKYIPDRLAGVTLLTPVINYWWPSFPTNLSTEAYNQMMVQDQWTFRVIHYAPWLLYWWNTQKWFPSSSVIANTFLLSKQDKEIAPRIDYSNTGHAIQQGKAESIFREAAIAVGNWEFDPMEIENPFPNDKAYVHLWQGDEDGVIPVKLQRYIVQRLPWIRYHELSGSGHMFPFLDGMFDKIVKVMLIGE